MGGLGKLIVCEIGGDVPEGETWRSLLFHWCAALNCYLGWMTDSGVVQWDLPHWHNERAQIGFLAAAVWRMGGVALEEYGTTRANNEATEVTKKTEGCCDLYFSVEVLDCVLESKLEWLTTYSDANAEQVKGKLGEAHKQLQSLDEKGRDKCEGMALCWGVATKSDNRDREEEKLRRFAHKMQETNRVVGVYYVPFQTRSNVEKDYGDGGETYPGVVLIGEMHTWE